MIAGLSATGWTAVSNWLYADQIASRARAEQARQDFDTVIKVRFCQASLSGDAQATVTKALVPLLGTLDPTPLPAVICSGMRTNQFELWFGSGTG